MTKARKLSNTQYIDMKKILLIIFSILIISAGSANAQAVVPSATAKIKIPILTYHSIRPYYPGITNLVKEYTVPPDIFDDQMKYMRDNGFTPIVPDDIVNYFTSGKALPQKPFMITLDDGWKNQFRYAFPILKKYNYPAVFYVYKNVIDKKVFLTWSEINTLSSSNMIIGNHTWSHPELPKITSSTALQQEIVDSKKSIEIHIGKTIDTFAYPFGEYNDQDVSLVKQAGYSSARALRGCIYQSGDILFTLCGVIITGDFNRFVSIVNRK